MRISVFQCTQSGPTRLARIKASRITKRILANAAKSFLLPTLGARQANNRMLDQSGIELVRGLIGTSFPVSQF